jgi:hypothetical protein
MKARGKMLAFIGGPVDRSKVSLRISGDNLELELITKMLGRKPTHSQKKGEKWKGKSGRELVRPTGLWMLQAPESKAANLDKQVAWIFNRLTAKQSIWRKLTSLYKVDLFCGLFLDAWNRGVEMSPKTLFEIGRRGVSIGFDIYADYPPKSLSWMKKIRRPKPPIWRRISRKA